MEACRHLDVSETRSAGPSRILFEGVLTYGRGASDGGELSWFQNCPAAITHDLLEQWTVFRSSPQPLMILGESGTGKWQFIEALLRGLDDRQVVRVCCATLFPRYARHRWEATLRVLHERDRQNTQLTWLFERIDAVPAELQVPLVTLVRRLCSRSWAGKGPGVISTAEPTLLERSGRSVFAELFHRLNVLELRLPPLRRRREDLPTLVAGYPLGRGQSLRLTSQASQLLSEHAWPGNMLELHGLLARLQVLTEGEEIDATLLRRHWQPSSPADPDFTRFSLEDAETHLILAALSRCDGNKTAAAEQLGITARTLHNKMAKYRRLGLVD